MEQESLHYIADIPQKAIIEYDGKVLIVQNEKGVWELPGGRLHKDEKPRDGLIREIQEELALRVKPKEIFDVGVFTGGETRQQHFVVVYCCELLDPLGAMVIDETEIKAIHWITKQELDTVSIRPMYQEMLRRYFVD